MQDKTQILAVIRTALANERTALAYGRTGMMFAISGITLIKFFPETHSGDVLGWVLIVAGLMTTGWGLYRFTRLRHFLNSIDADISDLEEEADEQARNP